MSPLLVGLGLAGPLTVELTGVVPDGQPLIVALFDASGGFPKAERAVRTRVVPASATTLRIELGEVGAGAWAVTVHHDEDADGQLDFSWLPPGPAEGTSASCPSRPFAMPTWGACSVVPDGSPLRLTMWY